MFQTKTICSLSPGFPRAAGRCPGPQRIMCLCGKGRAVPGAEQKRPEDPRHSDGDGRAQVRPKAGSCSRFPSHWPKYSKWPRGKIQRAAWPPPHRHASGPPTLLPVTADALQALLRIPSPGSPPPTRAPPSLEHLLLAQVSQ